MEITDVDAVLVSHEYPEGERLEWSAGRIESWDAGLVRVETDGGHVGWGEAGHALAGTEAVRGVVDALRDQVVGRDPENVRGIREDLYSRNLFWARGALPLGVMGAIEIALYDILGQAVGEPVYRLLGGRIDEHVPVYGSGGIAAGVDGRVEQAVEFADRGFDAVKVRALADPMANVAYVERLLDALPADVSVAFDAVQGTAGSPWSPKDAIRLAHGLEPYADRIEWYEEPCRAEDLAGYRDVREHTSLRVAGIESRAGVHEFRAVLDAGAVDLLQPDVTIAGGFTETERISGYAAAHDVPVALHVWGTAVSLLANAHYAAADPNVEVVEYCQLPNPLREEFLPDSFGRDGSHVTLPDEPGLGLDVLGDIEERYPFVPGKGHVFD